MTAHIDLLASLGLDDLVEPSTKNEPLTRADLERVVRAKNPLAAAALADARREATPRGGNTHGGALQSGRTSATEKRFLVARSGSFGVPVRVDWDNRPRHR